MKSVILDLDEDLTNEQIDAIIGKLQSKKKVSVPTVAILTKEENTLLNKIKKHIKPYFDRRYSPEDFDAENYRKYVIAHIKEDMSDLDCDIGGEAEYCEEIIDDQLDVIEEAKQEIINAKKDIVKWQKKLQQHKEMYKVVKQLEKEFAKRK